MDLAARTTARKFLEWQPCHPRNSTIPSRSSAKSNITGRAKSGHWVSRWLRFVARLDEEIEIGLSCSFIRRIAAKVVRDRYFYYDFSSNGANSIFFWNIVCRSLLISSLLDRELCILRLFHLIFKFCCIVFEDDYIYVLKKVTDKLKKYSTI